MAIARRTPQALAGLDPRTIGPYTVERKLVDAGTGPVFLARNNLGRPVLIKLITAPFARDTEFRRRLRIDLDHLRRLAPFCLAAILDLDTLARPPYVVVEYIDAPTLAASVEDDGPLHSADTARLAVGLAAALSALHGEGIVFGDLKPTNVVLSGRGLRLVDFGLARVLNAVAADNSSTSSSGVGTLAFISPEQALGQAVTAASDIFTWGGVLLFAATGQPPFGAGTPRALLQRAVYAEPDLSMLDPDLRDLVSAAMRKDPKRRPRAVDLLEHLMVGAPEDDPRPVPEHGVMGLPEDAAGAVAATSRETASRETTLPTGPLPAAAPVADEHRRSPAAPEAESDPPVEPEAESDSVGAPEAELDRLEAPEAESAPSGAPRPQPRVEAEAETDSQVAPEPAPEPEPEPEPTSEPVSEPESKPESVSKSELDPEGEAAGSDTAAMAPRQRTHSPDRAGVPGARPSPGGRDAPGGATVSGADAVLSEQAGARVTPADATAVLVATATALIPQQALPASARPPADVRPARTGDVPPAAQPAKGNGSHRDGDDAVAETTRNGDPAASAESGEAVAAVESGEPAAGTEGPETATASEGPEPAAATESPETVAAGEPGEAGGDREQPAVAAPPQVRADRGWLRRALSLGAATSLLVIPAFAIMGTVRDRGGAATSRGAAGAAIRLLDREPSLAGQLAVAAYRVEPTALAAQALVEASVRQIVASTGTIRGLRLTSDGRYLIAVGDAGGSVWDIADPARVRRVGELTADAAATAAGHAQLAADSGSRAAGGAQRGFSTAELTPDGVAAAGTGTADAPGATVAADSAPRSAGSALRAVTIVPRPSASATAPVPQTVVTAGADGVIRLWQLSPPRLVDDGTLNQVRTAAAEVAPLADLRGHVGAGTAVAVSADGRTLASAGADRTVRLWDVSRPRSPRALAVLTEPAAVTNMIFTPDGRSLVLGGPGHLAVWDVTDPRKPRSRAERTAAADVRAIVVSPGGRWFAATTTTSHGTQTEIFGLGDPRGLRRLASLAPGPAPVLRPTPVPRPGPVPGPAPAAAADTPGALALSAGGQVLVVGGAGGQITLWDVSEPSQPVRRGTLPVGATNGVTALGLAGPDGALAAAVGDGVRLWQLDLPAAQGEVCARVGDRISREQWHSQLGHRRYDPPCD